MSTGVEKDDYSVKMSISSGVCQILMTLAVKEKNPLHFKPSKNSISPANHSSSVLLPVDFFLVSTSVERDVHCCWCVSDKADSGREGDKHFISSPPRIA